MATTNVSGLIEPNSYLGTIDTVSDTVSVAEQLNLSSSEDWGHVATFVENGVGFTPDYTVPDVDVAAGEAFVYRRDATNLRLVPDTTTTLSLTDNATNIIFLAADLANDQLYFKHGTSTIPPTDPSIKIGEVDTSNDKTTVDNREPLDDVVSAAAGGVDVEDDGSTTTTGVTTLDFGTDLDVTQNTTSEVTVDASVTSTGDPALNSLTSINRYQEVSVSSNSVAYTDYNEVAVTDKGVLAYANESSSTLYILEISSPTSISEVATYTTASNDISGLAGAGDYIYVCGTDEVNSSFTGAFEVIDVSTPSSPTQASKVTDTALQGGRHFGVPAYSSAPNYLYVPGDGTGSLSGGLIAVDVSTPTSASIASTLSLSAGCYDAFIQDGYAWVAINTSNPGVVSVDISSPSSISKGVLETFSSSSDPQAIAYGGVKLSSRDMGVLGLNAGQVAFFRVRGASDTSSGDVIFSNKSTTYDQQGGIRDLESIGSTTVVCERDSEFMNVVSYPGDPPYESTPKRVPMDERRPAFRFDSYQGNLYAPGKTSGTVTVVE